MLMEKPPAVKAWPDGRPPGVWRPGAPGLPEKKLPGAGFVLVFWGRRPLCGFFASFWPYSDSRQALRAILSWFDKPPPAGVKNFRPESRI